MGNQSVSHGWPVLVAGHLRPDTDSAVSAHVYAQLLGAQDPGGDYRSVLLGEAIPQTVWLFESAGEPMPPVVQDFRVRVGEVARRDAPRIAPDACLGDAVRWICSARASMVPVVDEGRRLHGILSDRLPQANYFYYFNPEHFLGVLFTLEDLVKGLGLECWQAASRPAVGALTLEPGGGEPGGVLLSGDDPSALARAEREGLAAVLVAGGTRTGAWDAAIAAAPGLGVYRFPGTLMALSAQLPMAIPAHNVMAAEFPRLLASQSLEEVRETVARSPYALPVLDENGLYFGVISRTDILEAPRRRVVLVDHFERHQAGEGSAEAEVLEIVDHHRVGSIETTLPIRVDCRPVGSTASIIALKFREAGLEPSASQSLLLLGAIVADTLLLTSPTTTAADRLLASELARRAGVELDSFGREVLARNDETLSKPAEFLLEKDLKEFQAEGARFAVAQIETVDRMRLTAETLEGFARAMHARRTREAWDFLALMVTDSLRGDSLVLIDDAVAARRARLLGGNDAGGGPCLWPGCVSRKKQFLPAILSRLADLKNQKL